MRSGARSPMPTLTAMRQTDCGSFQSLAVLSGKYATAKKLGWRYSWRMRASVCSAWSGSSARMREISCAWMFTNCGER